MQQFKTITEVDGVKELLPILEEVLVRGSRSERRRYAAYLDRRAEEDLSLFAYNAAFGENRDRLPDSKLWAVLEETGDLAYVLHMWSQCALYRYWADVLRRNPMATLWRMGQ